MFRARWWLPVLMSACASGAAQNQHPQTGDPDPSHDGTSCRRAIVVDAQDEWSGALKEQAALGRIPGLKVLSQDLVVCEGKKMDVFRVHTAEGTSQVFFDISRYYGKLRR